MVRLFRVLCVGALLLSCLPQVFGEDSEFVRGEKFKLFPGIEGCEIRREGDKPVVAFILRIDTSKKNISFCTTPPNPNYEVNKRETVRQTTVDFLLENDLAVAVNANFYTPFNAETQKKPGDSNALGTEVWQGQLVSPPEQGYPTFTITADNQCAIEELGPNSDLSGIETAVAGSPILLRNGEINETNDKAVHPRTAVGLSGEGRYVWLLVIDGRQKGYSVGTTHTETAKIFQLFGVTDALNLDGGGSTTMVVARSKKAQHGGDEPYKVVNNPVGQGKAGTLRYNANHLGVRIGKPKHKAKTKKTESPPKKSKPQSKESESPPEEN